MVAVRYIEADKICESNDVFRWPILNYSAQEEAS